MAGTVAPEVFESEGLQFRRTTDDAKELLHQMREGGLGDDPLERAREYMDSDEVDDWGAMYVPVQYDDEIRAGLIRASHQLRRRQMQVLNLLQVITGRLRIGSLLKGTRPWRVTGCLPMSLVRATASRPPLQTRRLAPRPLHP
jgi:hypothetical protein